MLNRSSDIRLFFGGVLMHLARGGVLAACIVAFASAEALAAQPTTMKWTHFTIADPLPGSSWGTGGIPLADFDDDGDLDVVISRREPQTAYWFENPGAGRGDWRRREWPHVPIENASYGTSTRTWIADLNADGHNDIVYSDCDTGHSHVYWVENLDHGQRWARHPLPDPATAPGDVPGTGSFHSLGVADFDADGDLDVFAGEQEDPDTYMTSQGKLAMKPPGLKERGVIWTSTGGRQPHFAPVVIQIDNPGWHDAVLGDVDGDGDVDIVTKVWNKDGATYHADFWRNDTPGGGAQP